LIQHDNGHSALRRSSGSSADAVPKAFVYGKRTQPAQLTARGSFELTGVVFRPQGLHGLLRIDPAGVNNGPVNIGELFAHSLEDQLLSARSAIERLAVLVRCLVARSGDDQQDDVLVSESLRLIRERVRTIRILPLLKHLAISERQFERRFRKAVGVSPHRYLRIFRFQAAVRLLRDQHFARMSDLACELNYTDQSHFIKEISRFSGYTPTALLETVRGSVDLPCALILGPQV
jgi:AraC-like DNA-binding protein